MIRLLLVASALALSIGCGGTQKVKTTDPSGDAADLDTPDAETLAESPCGNPDWSELPKGSDPATP